MKNIRFLILLIIIITISCNSDQAEMSITDFSKSRTVILKPYKFYPYAMINVKVRGYVNDTINIKWSDHPDYDILLTGKVDTLLQTDYYGEGPRTFVFDPYKASEGELDIKISL